MRTVNRKRLTSLLESDIDCHTQVFREAVESLFGTREKGETP